MGFREKKNWIVRFRKNERFFIGFSTDKQKAIDLAVSQIERQHSKDPIMRLDSDEVIPVAVVPTGSIALDIALGVGGVPRGRIVEIFGHEASGKTTHALHIIAEVQKQGGVAAFVDVEHALDPMYAKADWCEHGKRLNLPTGHRGTGVRHC